MSGDGRLVSPTIRTE